MKSWMTEFLFVVIILSNLAFLIFAAIFFFVPAARSIGMGLVFLGVFLHQQKKGGIREALDDRKTLIRYDKEYERITEINTRYSFKNKSFIKKKELLNIKGLI
jgi:hypothetical protein